VTAAMGANGRPTSRSARPASNHLHEPEIEPGVVASRSGEQGHAIKVLRDGRVIRCSSCGTVRNAHLDKLDLPDPRNPGRTFRQRLDDIEAQTNAQVKAQRAAELDQDLSGLRQVQVTANNYPDVVPQPPVVLEFPDGTRVWRDTPGGPIRHQSVARAGTGRQHLEQDYYSAQEHGALDASPQYERSHTLGQGTGFESPYGILYAPRYVNQRLQNAGIERYLRTLAATQPAGTSYRVTTRTVPAQRNGLPTRRLGEIEYHVEIVSNGQVQPFFDYKIQITGSPAHPQITADPVRFANSSLAQAHAGRVQPPDILQQTVNETL
jgi:hypothetical protein